MSSIPTTFDFNRLWFANATDGSQLSLEPKTWTSGNVLIGKSWVWHPGSGPEIMWTLEADTQNFNPTPSSITSINTNERISASSLAEARATATALAKTFMENNFKRPDSSSAWPSIPTWEQYGGTYSERGNG
ncbi:hypothetical protein L6R50_08605 [Myxococcota bacterium]|nr:hypothetical protein [Myxococcota bacterium]